MRPYKVEELPDGSLRFDTEEEAEYPRLRCNAYATALKQALDNKGYFAMVV